MEKPTKWVGAFRNWIEYQWPKASFSRSASSHSGPGHSQLSAMPIIVGAPRSGTTLLRFILDAHPEIAIPPETGFLTIGATLKGKGDKLRERFFHAVTNYPESSPAWPDFEISAEEFRSALEEIAPFDISEGFRAFYRLYAARFGKSRWGDKTPIYCLSIDAIRRVLPEARFIHIIRDGRDVALSLRKMWFSPGPEMETQAAYWRQYIEAGRQSGLGRPDYLEIRYEHLIANTTETLERVCDFLDLEFDVSMLSFHTRTPERLKEHKGRMTGSGVMVTQEQRVRQQERTTQPPDVSRLDVWKREMTAEERNKFESVAGDLLAGLGYEV